MSYNKEEHIGITAIDIYLRENNRLQGFPNSRISYAFDQGIYLDMCLNKIYSNSALSRETKVLVENYILDDNFIRLLLSTEGELIVTPLLERFCSKQSTDSSISDIIENMPIEKLEELYTARMFEKQRDRLSSSQYIRIRKSSQSKRYSA
jgi:hypothetical protein